MPEENDQKAADEHYSYLCTRLESAFTAAMPEADFQCSKFAEALSIPVSKFETETYRNQHEMIRLKEAKITRLIFEDAVAAFFVHALHDYLRHVKVNKQKWSLFHRKQLNVHAAASRPLVLINSDGFLLRFSRALLAKQPQQFLNFLVLTDSLTPPEPLSFVNSTSKSNFTLFMQRNVLQDCGSIGTCHVILSEQLKFNVDSLVHSIVANLSIADDALPQYDSQSYFDG